MEARNQTATRTTSPKPSARPRLATSGTRRLAGCALLLAPVLAVADDLRLEDAIEAQASSEQASSVEAGRLPNLELSEGGRAGAGVKP